MATRKTSHAKAAETAPTQATSNAAVATAGTSTLEIPAATTFPPSDCGAALPASTSFHDVTFAEFKRLNRTIDDLPYAIVLAELDPDKFVNHVSMNRRSGYSAKAQASSADTASAVDVLGGVPLSRYLDKSLADLTKSLFTDVEVKDVYKVIDDGSVAVGGAKKAPIMLSDADRADLLAGQPTLVRTRIAGADKMLRLMPAERRDAVPMRNDYHVGTADEFIRSPYVEATDGSLLRVPLNVAQLKALSTLGQAAATVAGRKVTLRASKPTQDSGGRESTVLYAIKDGGQRGDNIDLEGNEGTPPKPPKGSGSAGSGSGSGRAGTGASGGSEVALEEYPDDPPSQTRLPLALYIPWRHRWILRGYSRGELLHSMALGPQEEVTLEISTWDRRKRTFEDSAHSEFEQTTEFTETSKDAQSVIREASSQTELGLTIGATVGVKAEVVNFTGSSTAQAKAALANSSKNNLEILRETVAKASSKLKLQRETKISESTEYGVENKVTRKVRNPNLCHTLTLNYYEVLAHYDIVTEFNKDDARLCVLDPNPVQSEEFSYTNIRYYESVLKRVLLVPDLAPGFDAAKKLFSQDQLCEARRRNELCSAVSKIVTTDDGAKQQLAEQAKRAVDAFISLAAAKLEALPVPSPWQLISPWPVLTLVLLDKAKVQKYMYLRRARAIAPNLFDVLAAIRSDPRSEASVQRLAEALNGVTFSTLSTSAIGQDKDAMYKVLRADLHVPAPVIFTDIPEDAYAVNDAGLMSMLNTFSETVRAIGQAQQLAAGKAAMEANQGAVQTDYSNKEIAEALEAVQSLSKHLNRYRNYYRTCILTLMPFPDAFQNRLSMLPMVERRVLGFDNNDVALPIKAGLDPRTEALFRELVLENKELTSTRTQQAVSLPTSGVHVEARLGECCACEDYIDDLRMLDLHAKEADIDLKHAMIAQQEIENKRRQARLTANDLDDPVAHPPVLRVETVTVATPGPPPAIPATPTP